MQYSKAWVALAMAILGVLESQFGLAIGLTEQWIETLLFVLTPILVWLVPNK